MAKGKGYHGLNEKELEELFKILKKEEPIGAIKQYIDALKELYKNKNLNSCEKENTYYPVLGIAVSLLEISLLRLWYFIKRKNGESPKDAKIGKKSIYTALSDIPREFEKIFGSKIDSWDKFLENSEIKELYCEQRKKEKGNLKRFRNAVIHGKIAGLQEEELYKTNILLCIDCAMITIVGILKYFHKLTEKYYLLGNMKTWELTGKAKKGEGKKLEGLSPEERKEIESKINEAREKLL